VRLEQVTIAGFRCFGPQPVRISLSGRITTLVGPNGSGKTALLHALGRLFATSRAQRTVVRSDFHLMDPLLKHSSFGERRHPLDECLLLNAAPYGASAFRMDVVYAQQFVWSACAAGLPDSRDRLRRVVQVAMRQRMPH